MTEYIKFRFTKHDGSESTAGLILTRDKFRTMSVSDLSRLFPMFEATKMQMLEVSDSYGNWEAAFNHSFDRDDNGMPLGPNIGSWSYNVKGLDHQT